MTDRATIEALFDGAAREVPEARLFYACFFRNHDHDGQSDAFLIEFFEVENFLENYPLMEFAGVAAIVSIDKFKCIVPQSPRVHFHHEIVRRAVATNTSRFDFHLVYN